MRIHFIENTCNANYVAVKFLRQAGVDAHLFYPSDDHFQKNPISEDPSLARGLPDWLHPYTRDDIGSNPYLDVPEPFLYQLAQCDLLHAQDVGLVWAAKTGKPYVWQPHGSDLYFKPFYGYWRERLPWSKTEVLLVVQQIRQAIQGADAILIQWWFAAWEKGLELIGDLDCRHRIIHLPFAFVGEQFSPSERPQLESLLPGRHLYPNVPILFHPSRQLLRPDQTEYFGNEKLYCALGQLRRRGHPFLLVVIEKGNPDEALAKAIIREYGIEPNVVWVPQMPRQRLIDWYRTADLTICELAGGSTGSVAIEAMACGCPVMANFLLQSDKSTFWPPTMVPPIINVDSVESIVASLERAIIAPTTISHLRSESRAWVAAYVAGPAIARQYRELYERVLRSHPNSPTNPSVSAFDELTETLDDPHRHFGVTGFDQQKLLRCAEQLAQESYLQSRQSEDLPWICKALARALVKSTGLNRLIRKHPRLHAGLVRRWKQPSA